MFIHPTDDYDFVIHLQPSLITRYTQNLTSDPSVWGAVKKYANLTDPEPASVYGETVRLNFDPIAMLVGELEASKSSFMVAGISLLMLHWSFLRFSEYMGTQRYFSMIRMEARGSAGFGILC